MPSLPKASRSSPLATIKQAWSSVRSAVNGDPSGLGALETPVLAGYRRRRIYFAFIPSGGIDGRQTITLTLSRQGEVVWQARDLVGNTYPGTWISSASAGWHALSVANAANRRSDLGGLPSYAMVRAPSSAETYAGPCAQGMDCIQFHSVWQPTATTGGEEVWQVNCHPLTLYCDADTLALTVSGWSYSTPPSGMSAPAWEYFIGCLSDP